MLLDHALHAHVRDATHDADGVQRRHRQAVQRQLHHLHRHPRREKAPQQRLQARRQQRHELRLADARGTVQVQSELRPSRGEAARLLLHACLRACRGRPLSP